MHNPVQFNRRRSSLSSGVQNHVSGLRKLPDRDKEALTGLRDVHFLNLNVEVRALIDADGSLAFLRNLVGHI